MYGFMKNACNHDLVWAVETAAAAAAAAVVVVVAV